MGRKLTTNLDNCQKKIIYMAVNKINNKIYIGKTVNTLHHRSNEHKNQSFNNKQSYYNSYFHKAIRKYGFENFDWSILQTFPDSVSDELISNSEIWWINYYESNNRTIGYNITSGGNGVSGWKMDENTKRKIGQANKGRIGRMNGRSKSVIDLTTGIIYESCELAAKAIGSPCGSRVNLCAHGKIESHKGHKYKFVKEE